MDKVPAELWARWPEAKAEGCLSPRPLCESPSGSVDSVGSDEHWQTEAMQAQPQCVAATPAAASGSCLPAEESHGALSHSLLEFVTGFSLPPTTSVSSVAEALTLKALVPSLLPTSQLLDRRKAQAMEPEEELRHRLAMERGQKMRAGRARLATLDPDILWVLGLNKVNLKSEAKAAADAAAAAEAGDPPEPSTGLAAQAVEPKVSTFKRLFMSAMSQGLARVDWFGEGELADEAEEDERFADTLRIMRRVGMNARSVQRDSYRRCAEAHSVPGGQAVRLPSRIARSLRVMLQGLSNAERRAYVNRVRWVYAKEMKALFKHYDTLRRRSNRRGIFSDDVNAARALAKATLPQDVLGGVVLPVSLVRDLVLFGIWVRRAVRAFICDPRFRAPDGTLHLARLLVELPSCTDSAQREALQLMPWLKQLPFRKPTPHAPCQTTQPPPDFRQAGAAAQADQPAEHPPLSLPIGSPRQTAMGADLERLEQLKRELSREFLGRVRSTRWLITGAYSRSTAIHGAAPGASSTQKAGSSTARSLHTHRSDGQGTIQAQQLAGDSRIGRVLLNAAPELQALNRVTDGVVDGAHYRPGALVEALLSNARRHHTDAPAVIARTSGGLNKRATHGRRRRRRKRREARKQRGTATVPANIQRLASIADSCSESDAVQWRARYSGKLQRVVAARASIKPRAMVPRHLYCAPPIADRSTAKSQALASNTARLLGQQQEAVLREAKLRQHVSRRLSDRLASVKPKVDAGDRARKVWTREVLGDTREKPQRGRIGSLDAPSSALTSTFGPALDVVSRPDSVSRRHPVQLALPASVEPQTAVYVVGDSGGQPGVARAAVPPTSEEHADKVLGEEAKLPAKPSLRWADSGLEELRTPFEYHSPVSHACTSREALSTVDVQTFHVGQHAGGRMEGILVDDVANTELPAGRIHLPSLEAGSSKLQPAGKVESTSRRLHRSADTTGRPQSSLPATAPKPQHVDNSQAHTPSHRSAIRSMMSGGGEGLLRALDVGAIDARAVANDRSLPSSIRGAAARVAASRAAPSQLQDSHKVQVRSWAEAGGIVHVDSVAAGASGGATASVGNLMIGKVSSGEPPSHRGEEKAVQEGTDVELPKSASPETVSQRPANGELERLAPRMAIRPENPRAMASVTGTTRSTAAKQAQQSPAHMSQAALRARAALSHHALPLKQPAGTPAGQQAAEGQRLHASLSNPELGSISRAMGAKGPMPGGAQRALAARALPRLHVADLLSEDQAARRGSELRHSAWEVHGGVR